METPTISVIVPVYNVKPYLVDCLDSLIRQNYPKLEIILVDDGSTDGSGVDCDAYAKKDPRIRVIHQANGGLSNARNRGIKEATGTYITFVDSDDTVAPDYVQYLFTLISKHQAQVSICALQEITVKGREINYGTNYIEKVMSTEEALGRMLREDGFTVVAYAKLYKRELWNNVSFPEKTVHEDLGTTYKVIQKCPRIAYGPEPKYIYKKRTNSISTSEFNDQKFDIIKLTDEMCDAIDRNFPYLQNTTNLRRCHARFSVLRQIPAPKQLSAEQLAAEQEIVTYLKTHKKDVTKNPSATLRDKFAIYALLINKEFFKFCWRFYSKITA